METHIIDDNEYKNLKTAYKTYLDILDQLQELRKLTGTPNVIEIEMVRNQTSIWLDFDLEFSFDDETLNNLDLFDKIHAANLHNYNEMMTWQRDAIEFSLNSD